MKARRRASWLAGVIMMATLGAATRGWGADSSNATDPLLDLFIKKGFVTQKEAEQVEAEAESLHTNEVQMPPAPPSKWKISEGIKHIELFGDVRLRYEDRSAEDPGDGTIGLQRLRYSVRVGLRGEAFDDFYYGVRLDTSANPRSAFATFGTSSSGTPYQGPFGKSTAGVNIGQVYLGWQPWDWVDLTVGKMPNPLYTTPMVWNGNISPEGAAEHFKYTVGEADFFVTLGQFLYEDTNPTTASGGFFGVAGSANLYGGNGSLPFLLAWQGGANYHISKQVSFKVAPVLYWYIGQGVNVNQGSSLVTPSFSDTYIGQGATGAAAGFSGYPLGYYDGFSASQTGINDLMVLEVPMEFDLRVKKLNLRFFGDYAYNFQGAKRAQEAYTAAQTANITPNGPETYGIQLISSPQTRDVHAYQIGFGIGSTNLVYGPMQGAVYGTSSSKNAWELRTYWQHIEQYSLDPNLLDTDFFEGRENLQGVYVALAYCFTDNIIGTFRYGHASRINDLLGTGGSGQDIPQMNPIDHFDVFQVDLTLRF